MRTQRKLFALFAAPALVLLGCGSGPDQPQTVAGDFADALTRADIAAAAALTDDPAAAISALDQLYDGLGKQVEFQVDSTDDDEFTPAATWKFGKGAAGGVELHRHRDRAGPRRLEDPLGSGDDRPGTGDGSARIQPARPGSRPDAGFRGRRIDDPAGGDAGELAAIRGVTLAPQTRLLTTDKALSSPTLSGLADLWQSTTDAATGWSVHPVNPDVSGRVAGGDPRPTPDIRTTLDPAIQRDAEAALDAIAQPAAVVALRPSTGAVVAMAQNAAADAQGPIALTGLYPPGSTFKTVTVSAAMQAGEVTPDTGLPCPGVADIEGRRIPNDDNFDLGPVALHTAFARSCNTTMAALGVGLPPDGLTTAAAQLGLGVDFVTPGLTTVTGKVPTADTPAMRVESSIGQGRVTASPFGMALVAASIARGSVPAPVLVAGQPGVADRTPQPLPPATAEQIETMMRETVTGGTATQLGDIPGLLGKTGTAEYGDNTHAHGWFVGIDASADLAFAVFVADAGSSAPAVEAAGRMLRAPR